MKRSRLITGLIIAASISTMVVVFQHRSSSTRCSLDGIGIDPLYEVTIIRKDETRYNFSCILSAQIWLTENAQLPLSVWVTDEVTGKKIRSELAYYVESDVVTTPHTRNRIHAFAGEKAAKLHACQYKGKFVKNPFRVRLKRPMRVAEYSPCSPDPTGTISHSTQKPLCLACNTVLSTGPYYMRISEGRFNQLPKGFSRPREKPPKNLLLI
ncbi:MAG: hypothetical protein AMK69_23705 [Nitrospira bacterium SG8_3]|nr:MAG: hypothetical protein AMK69_23705 [Nitrospira bacterium SG8_3]